MRLRFPALLLLVLLCVISRQSFAQIPADDARNTNTRGVKTPVTLPHFNTLEEWKARKQSLRLQVLQASGLYPMPKRTPLKPQIFGRIEGTDYTIEKVLIETMPGYYLGGNLYRPKHTSGKHPAVLNPHGHWQYGRLENQPLYSGESFGVSMAKLGFVVFAYDMVGYTDTVQTPHDFATHETESWSFTPLGLQLWNSVRSLDFIASLDDVDSTRIGMAGASGGGTQTFLLTAIDDRIQFAVPVNMVSAIMQGGDVCENAPGLRIDTSNVEIAAMFAPKPMLLVSATGDWTRNVPRQEFPAIQSIYRLYGKADEVTVTQIDAKHNFNQQSREAVYRFFSKQALHRSDAGSIMEPSVNGHKLQEMMATANHPLPSNALPFNGVYSQWKAMGTTALSQSDPATRRTALQLALHAQYPAKVLSKQDGERIVLTRPDTGDNVRGLLIPGDGTPALVVAVDGLQAARTSTMAQSLLSTHRTVLFLEPFQTGDAVTTRDRSTQFFSTYNVTDDQARVQDIVTAIAFLKETSTSHSIDLYGSGKAAVWSLLAATVVPDHVNAHINARDITPVAIKEGSLELPGLQRAGGISAAIEIAKPIYMDKAATTHKSL